jgi:hypothetical protein
MAGYRILAMVVVMVVGSVFADKRVDPADPDMSEKRIDAEEMERRYIDFIRNKPEQERLELYTTSIQGINLKLTSGKRVMDLGALALFSETLGKENEFASLIEDWFAQYANGEPMLTEWIYRLKPVDEWYPLFNAKYRNLTNESVRQKMRVYTFFEKRPLEDRITEEELMNPRFANLAVSVSYAGSSDGYHECLVQIENTGNRFTYVFPHLRVATEWTRNDGILLPGKNHYKPAQGRFLEEVFLRQGETLSYTLRLKAFERSRTKVQAPFSSDHAKELQKDKVHFVDKICVALGNETIGLQMKAVLPAYSDAEATALKDRLAKEYGPKSGRFLILENPLRSNSIELTIDKGVLKNSR